MHLSLARLYWEVRYALGGTSGDGSKGRLARFKADTLNAFVRDHDVQTVIEFGCGDGRQLELASYPHYIGLDPSRKAIGQCKTHFDGDDTKSFFLYSPPYHVDHHNLFSADVALSLDVIYHLVSDEIFDLYMRQVFSSARRYVVVYSSNTDRSTLALHVKHRRFTDWTKAHLEDWHLADQIDNPYSADQVSGSGAPHDFYIFENTSVNGT